MFGKQKKKGIFNILEDRRTVIHDFRLRTSRPLSCESVRAANYLLYHKLDEDEMLPRLDEHLNKLLAGEVDSANDDMLDAIIFAAAREGVPFLEQQRCEHADIIRRLIVARKANNEDLRRIRNERVVEYESLKAEYDELCRLSAGKN